MKKIENGMYVRVLNQSNSCLEVGDVGIVVENGCNITAFEVDVIGRGKISNWLNSMNVEVMPFQVGSEVSSKMLNDNVLFTSRGGNYWKKERGVFSGNYTIEKIKEVNGRLAAFISGTVSTYKDYLELCKLVETPTKESLLEEAKRRYPIGTKFYPAHMNNRSEYCIVTNNNFRREINAITALTNESTLWSKEFKYGNTTLSRVVWHKGKWAEIVQEEEKLDLNNTVIEVLDIEHGKQVIQWWKDKGVNTGTYEGINTKDSGDTEIYYGCIKEIFQAWRLPAVKEYSVKIITLPEIKTIAMTQKITKAGLQHLYEKAACDKWKQFIEDKV